jgi:hypothetical protein
MQKHRLFLFQFEYINNKYLFPVYYSYSDFSTSEQNKNFIKKILSSMEEIPGVKNVKKWFEKEGDYDKISEEHLAILGEPDYNIKKINIRLETIESLSVEDISDDIYDKISIKEFQLPVRKLKSAIEFGEDEEIFIVIEQKV